MKRKILVLMMVVFISLFSMNLKTYASDNIINDISIENNTLYANGNSFILKKATDGNVYAYVDENTKLSEKNLNQITTIYGGAKNQTVNKNIDITVDNINIASIYGGGYSDGTAAADVNGDITIRIIGKADTGSIYGGGYARPLKNGNAQANVNGDITIHISANPTSNHNDICGGGYACTNNNYSATSNVSGSISIDVINRVYSVRGGGYADSNKSTNGLAQANVGKGIQLLLKAVDIREVYGGGYASYHAQANVKGLIDISISKQSEVCILEGGGAASDTGEATSQDIQIDLVDCINLYGYILAGGSASNNANAKVNHVNLKIYNSCIPAFTQFGSIVRAGVNGGGKASNGGIATAQKVSLDIRNCETAGTIYSGGEVSSKGNADVVFAEAYYENNSGSEFEGQIYNSSVIAGGSNHDITKANVKNSEITVVNCDFENVWGGNELSGNPESMEGKSHFYVSQDLSLDTLANFDSMTIQQPLHVKMMMGKTATKSTTLVVDDSISVGTPLVYCDDIVEMEDVLTIENNKLEYAIVDNVSVWSLGQMTYTIQTQGNTGGVVSASHVVNKFASSTVNWTVNDKYQVDKILVDGVEVSVEGNSYTFYHIEQNHIVEVQFKKIPGTVNNYIEVEKDPAVPHISVDLDSDKINELLSEKDKEAIADGKSIQFQLDVNTITTLPSTVMKEIEKVVDKENILMSFDMSMFKNIGGNLLELDQTNTAMRIVLDIPQKYIQSKGNKEFAILRVHENSDGTFEAEILKDLDNNDLTITFETDRFSVYSLIYDVDKDKQHFTQDYQNAVTNVQTDDLTQYYVYIAGIIISILGIGVLIAFHKKK